MTQTPPSALLLPSDRWQSGACRGWAPSLTPPQLALAVVLATGLITATPLPAYLHVTVELTTLEPLTACQGKKVMIWSRVPQIIEHGVSTEEFQASVFTKPGSKTKKKIIKKKHMHISMSM